LPATPRSRDACKEFYRATDAGDTTEAQKLKSFQTFSSSSGTGNRQHDIYQQGDSNHQQQEIHVTFEATLL
jgi:hypothetical protein